MGMGRYFGRARQVAAALAAALLLAFAASACGGGSGDDTKPTSAATSKAGGKGVSVAPDPNQQPVTLEFLDWGGDQYKKLNAAINAAFQAKYPNITLKTVPVPYEQYPARLRAAAASRRGGDVVSGFPGAWAASFKQALEPLDAYLSPQQRDDWSVLSSSVAPDGKTYIAADSAYAYVYAYNKALFDKAGLAGPPKTFDELLSACDALNKSGVTPIAAGWKDGYYAEGFLFVFAGMLMDQDQRKKLAALDLPLTDPVFERALGFLRQMDERKCFGKGAEGRVYYDDLRNQFASGKAAMVLEPAGGGPVEKGGQYPKRRSSACSRPRPCPTRASSGSSTTARTAGSASRPGASTRRRRGSTSRSACHRRRRSSDGRSRRSSPRSATTRRRRATSRRRSSSNGSSGRTTTRSTRRSRRARTRPTRSRRRR
jgi:ABC-type glycerol-3-phosphate transport system substrate-binding protein